jgi:hypothetical protein
LVGLGLELRSLCLQSGLSHISTPFCSGYFGDGGLTNYLPRLGSNLLTSASQKAQLGIFLK